MANERPDPGQSGSAMRILAGLAARSVPWTTLRDELGATTADMNLLTSRGLIERDHEAEIWRLTGEGIRAARKAGIPVVPAEARP